MMPSAQMVLAGGKQLEVRLWGALSGQTALVLLHEGLGSVDLWRGFPEALHSATGLPVVAYSRAGHGRSDADDLPRPLDWMTREAVEVLPSLLSSLGVNESVLIGHSDGATIAALHTAYAIGRSKVRGVVLIAPHFFTEPMGLVEIARAKETFLTSDLPARMGKYHNDPNATFDGWADAWLDPAFVEWNVEAALDEINVPVLAVQGREDQYGTLAQIDAVERRVNSPVETLILEGCKHVPHLEEPEVVCAAIHEFCTIIHNMPYIESDREKIHEI